MKDFCKTYKLVLWVVILGIPLIYCEFMWFSRAAAVTGCQAAGVYNGSYESRVYCNRKADSLTWGWKADFNGMGKVWTWDEDAEIYVEKK